MFFFLSLGSNIDGELSAIRMLGQLVSRFRRVGAYPFFYTEPEDIVSDCAFVNGLVIIYAEGSEACVKNQLNDIEISMGRDRRDPKRSVRSRAADIDILGASAFFDLGVIARASEPYVQQCFNMAGARVPLEKYGLTAYQRASTIDFDAGSGQIRVVEDEFQGFINWVEATFGLQ